MQQSVKFNIIRRKNSKLFHPIMIMNALKELHYPDICLQQKTFLRIVSFYKQHFRVCFSDCYTDEIIKIE